MSPKSASCAPDGSAPSPLRPEGLLPPALAPSADLILGSISDLVEVIDTRGVITYSKQPPSCQLLLGLGRVLGRPCHLVYDRVCLSCAECPLDRVFASGKRLTLESRVKLAQGKSGWVRQRLYPMPDGRGGVCGVLRLVFDITKEKRKQAEEAEYLDSLEQSLANRDNPEPFPLAQALSARELEVLSHLAGGLSNQEIGRVLGISRHTVKTHVTHIFNKLGVGDRTQAAVAAFRLNLI